MTYEIEIRDRAQRDLEAIPPKDAARISLRIAPSPTTSQAT